MNAPAGWYPDPGGRPGAYRYWDGQTWSAVTQDGLPSSSSAPAMPSAAPSGAVQSSPYRPGTAPATGARKRPIGWIIGLVALVVVVAVIGVLAVRVVSGVVNGDPLFPGQNPSENVCPTPDPGSPAPQPNDGRVYAGRLSYPKLGSPWGAPEPEYRVAFGRDVLQQYVEVEKGNFGQYTSWGAALVIGELVAGDGFFTPREGAAIVMKCVTGTFYGDNQVTRDDRRNQALQVDGHDAWVIESNLGFDVPGLQAKHELLIVVIVDTGDGAGGLFLATIPENSPQYVAPARQALAGLRVS